MSTALATQGARDFMPFGYADFSSLSTIGEVCDAIKKLNALKPLVNLLEDAHEKKRQILLAEIEIAKKLCTDFPNDLKRVYRSDKRVVIAKFWASQTNKEIATIIASVKCIEFMGTYREYVGEKNEKKVKREIRRIQKSGEIVLIEQEVAAEIAREEVRETIRERMVEEIEKELDAELEDSRSKAESRADAEYEKHYEKALQKAMKGLPRNIQEIKEAIRSQAKNTIERRGSVDVQRVVQDVLRLRSIYDWEFAELFHSYTANYIKRKYDVCLGLSAYNKSTYFLWERATEPQRRDDVWNKMELIINDLTRLSKRNGITRYVYKEGPEHRETLYRNMLCDVITKIQEQIAEGKSD